MNTQASYSGSCFCGTVRFTLNGEPEAMAYCHCNSCRHWSAGPVSAFTLWKPDALRVTQGTEHINTFNKNPGSDDTTVMSERQWCGVCGGHICTAHPTMGLIDVPAVVIDGLTFKPAFTCITRSQCIASRTVCQNSAICRRRPGVRGICWMKCAEPLQRSYQCRESAAE